MIFNQYSFFFIAGASGIILAAMLWGILLVLRVSPRRRMFIFVLLVLLYISGIVAYNVARHYPAETRTLEDVETTLNNGRPTFLMLYSNY